MYTRARSGMELEQASDEELVGRHARGERAAFEALVARHFEGTYRVALRALGDPGAAEDAAQEAMVGLLQAGRRFQPGRSFRAFLTGILVNKIKDADRRRRRLERREGVAAGRRRPALDPEQDVALARREVEEHVRRLPCDVRVPILLHYYEGRTHAEVAEALACPAGTASSRIRRGLEELRASLVGAGQGGLAGAVVALLGGGPVVAPLAPSLALLQTRAAAGRKALALLAGQAAAALALVGLTALALLPAAPAPPAAPGSPAAPVASGGPAAPPPAPAATAVVATSGSPAAVEVDDLAALGLGPSVVGEADAAEAARDPLDDPGRPVQRVVVRDRVGRPVAGAVVHVDTLLDGRGLGAEERRLLAFQSHRFGGSWRSGPRRTDARGELWILRGSAGPGSQVMVMAAKGVDAGIAGPVRVEGPEAAPLEVVLRPAGEPLPGCGALLVTVEGPDGPLAGTPVFGRCDAPGMQGGVDVVTDDRGRVAFPDLEPAPYRLVLEAGGLSGELEVDVAPGEVLERAVRLAAPRRAELWGPLALGPGIDLEAVELSAQDLRTFETRHLWRSHLDDRLGYGGELPPGRYRVSATAPNVCRVAAELEVGASAEVAGPELRLGLGPAVRGRVVGATRATVELESDEGWSAQDRMAVGEDGRFELRGVAPGRYLLAVSPAGEPRRWVQVGQDDVDLGDLPAGEPSLEVRVVVLDAAGAPCPHADVLLLAHDGQPDRRRTRASGTCMFQEVRRGPITVVASRGDLSSRPRELVLDEATGEVTLSLSERAGAIAGRVTGPAEHLARGLRVVVAPAEGAPHPLGRREALVGVDGRFDVAAVPPGRYTVAVAGPGAPVDVTVRAGGHAEVEVALAPGAALEVRLEGAPRGAVLCAIGRSDARRDLVLDRWLPGGGGSALIDGLTPGPGRAGVMVRRGRAETVLLADVTLRPDEPARVSFRWPPERAGAIAGTVATPGVYTRVFAVQDGVCRALLVADADGAFTFDLLPPGRYRVVAVAGHGREPRQGGVEVDVAPGRTANAGRAAVVR